ncbi:MAG: hypothetical protein M3444_17870, partial [Acidobacteriota bacterium]|nr:hypothetical protein [Acidobacteriota bacterium]
MPARRMRRPATLILLAALLCAQAPAVRASPRAAGNAQLRRANSSRHASYRLSRADEAFLEDLSRRAFQYFVDHADARTGLVLDRARATGEAPPPGHPSHNIASSAATGFGLTALCIGASRGW